MAHIFLEDGKIRKAIELAPDLPAKIGRALQGAVVLEDGAASREHCLLERTPAGWLVRDLGSRNGTRHNGRLLGKEPQLLTPGDRIEIGQAVISFAGEGETGAAAVQALEAAARARETSTATASALAQDPLTGLATFPLLWHELRQRLAQPNVDETATLRPTPLALLLVDVDGLGLMNDIFGFRSGDEIVRLVGLEVQRAVSGTEGTGEAVVAREGGGKLGVLVPGLDVNPALALAETIRKRVAARPLEGPLREASVTVSVGVASAPEDAATWRELLRRAEAALSRAKREGRDRVARPPALKLAPPAGVLSGLFALPRVRPPGEPGRDELSALLLKKDSRAAIALVAQALGTDLELDALSKLVLTVVLEKTGARRGFLVLKDHRSGELRLVEAVDRDASSDKSKALVLSHGILKEALASKDALLVEDAASDPRFKKRASVVLEQPRSVLAAPIRASQNGTDADDDALGVIYLDHRGEPGCFTREHKDLVRMIARLLAGPVRRWERTERASAELQRARLMLERTAEAEARRHAEHKGLVGEGKGMRDLHRAIERAAASELPVAISGESGVGKELVARAIHAASARARGPFVAENVAALPETLLEAELFGHARGAFTGALQERAGLFEAAAQGTLFLDEVGEMSPRLQAKLLRVLQEKEVRRIGEEAPRKIDVRLVTATNKDLEKLAADGTFRKDLLYRIRVLTVDVPPLRSRREDIPRLLEHFLAQASPLGRAPRISKDALALLVHHDWPGNVRELENESKKLVALGSEEIGTGDLSPAIRGEARGGDDGTQARKAAVDDGAQAILNACGNGKPLTAVLESFEREAISRVLVEQDGNRTLTARRLGITRQGLHKKLKRYGFDA
jgi:Nif-specific regulatory protein